ncbi:MAG: efflux RND transporter periplasmic adaptor subunit [Chloroflexota bacterium]
MNFLRKNRTLLIVLLVLAVAAAAFFYLRQSNTASAAAQWQTAKIETGNLVATVGATGTVRPNQTAVIVWQSSGTVEDVSVKVGDRVSDGDVLAALEKTSLSQNIILAEADLATARTALEDLLASKTPAAQSFIALRAAQEKYDKAFNYRDSLNGPITVEKIKMSRIKIAGKTYEIPEKVEVEVMPDVESIDEADADLALAEAQLDDARRAWERVKDGPSQADIIAAEARIAAAQATLNMARLTAPFAGTISEAHPMPGDQVGAGVTAFRIDDLSRLLVDVQISEVDINSIQVGQEVSLSFDAILDKKYHGVIAEVGKVGSNVGGVVNFTVTVELTDADEQVKPGMTAAVNIVVREINDVLLVPNRAVRLVDGKRVVYLLLEDGTLEQVEIRLGSSSDTMSVLASENLEEGDQVVLNPPQNFGNDGPPFMQR